MKLVPCLLLDAPIRTLSKENTVVAFTWPLASTFNIKAAQQKQHFLNNLMEYNSQSQFNVRYAAVYTAYIVFPVMKFILHMVSYGELAKKQAFNSKSR